MKLAICCPALAWHGFGACVPASKPGQFARPSAGHGHAPYSYAVRSQRQRRSPGYPQVRVWLCNRWLRSSPGLTHFAGGCGVLPNGDTRPLVLGVLAGLLALLTCCAKRPRLQNVTLPPPGLPGGTVAPTAACLSARYQATGPLYLEVGLHPPAARTPSLCAVGGRAAGCLAGASRKLPQISISGADFIDRLRAGRQALPERLLPAGRRAHLRHAENLDSASSLCAPSIRPGQMPVTRGSHSACLRGDTAPPLAVLGAVLSFIACGTYEIGYALLLALVVWLLRRRSVKTPCWTRLPRWRHGRGACVPRSVRAQRRHRQRAFSIFPPCCASQCSRWPRRSLG